MVRNFGKPGAVVAVVVLTVVGLCVIAGLGLAQVPSISDNPVPSKPKPKTKTTPTPDTPPDSITKGTPNTISNPAALSPSGTPAKARVAPGTLATKDAPGTPPSSPDGDVEVSAAGEPIVVRVQNIMAPVTVFDKDGNLMDHLQPSQFRLFDNGVEQDIHVDTESQPISLVVAIEASYRDDAILKQIHKIGGLIEPLITGNNGEVAVIAFDHNIKTMQDFTNDTDKIKTAIAKITSGSTSARMVDAVDEAVLMLRHRPRNRRRIILAITEQRDKGSFAHGRQTLIALQLSNISFYSVDINQIARRLTEQAEPPRPDPLPPAAYNMPMGANTPTQIDQTTGRGNSAELMPALQEIYTDAKAIFKRNPVEVFAQGTGGEKFSFLKQHGLEDAISKIAAEIHTQYIINYNPKAATALQGGFHQIEVTVDYPRAKVRTRPGYWLAPSN